MEGQSLVLLLPCLRGRVWGSGVWNCGTENRLWEYWMETEGLVVMGEKLGSTFGVTESGTLA